VIAFEGTVEGSVDNGSRLYRWKDEMCWL